MKLDDKNTDIQILSQSLKVSTCCSTPSECGSTVAMRTSAAEVNQTSSSSGQCFSNASYHTVAQCNVVSTISSNLDGTLTLKVRPLSKCVHIQFHCPLTPDRNPTVLFLSQSSTLKSRNGSEWRAYCNLNDIGQSSSLFPSHTTYIQIFLMLWNCRLKGKSSCGVQAKLMWAPAWMQLPCCE